MGTQTRRSMRKLFIYMVILALCSCEVIKDGDRLIRVDMVEGERVHELLEFTGFRCVNCPNASAMAEELKEKYKDHLLVVALHPASNPFTQGKYDYTCPGADSIYTRMGGTASTPFPIGNVDMGEYKGEYLHDANDWTTMVYEAMKTSQAPMLSASAKGDTVTRTIQVAAEYNTFDDRELALWLVEDSVQGVQAMPDGSTNLQYMHRHMIRETTRGTSIQAPEGCNMKKCHVVALLLDKKDNHILNAYETTIDFGTDH